MLDGGSHDCNPLGPSRDRNCTIPMNDCARTGVAISLSHLWFEVLNARHSDNQDTVASISKKIEMTDIHPARGDRKGRVGLLAGCAQQVLAPEIISATIQVLNHPVVVP